ncbi:hypothetical protein K443DRAFT_81782, partial [Laccaria amethystina LaAM-08-1]
YFVEGSFFFFSSLRLTYLTVPNQPPVRLWNPKTPLVQSSPSLFSVLGLDFQALCRRGM